MKNYQPNYINNFHKISVAPMMDCTDKHFRMIMRKISSKALLYTEMIVAQSLIYTNKGSTRGHHRHPEFDEYIFFIDGFGVYEEKLNSGKVEIIKVTTGDCIYIPKNAYHTFIPLTDNCKAVALITKKWDECDQAIIKE